MARVTVEDCLGNVDNRFELVLVASKRARQIARDGAEPLVPAEGDKSTVIALREIAEGIIDKTILEGNKRPVRVIVEAETLINKGGQDIFGKVTEEKEVNLEKNDSDSEFEEISQEIINETQTTELEPESQSILQETTILESTDFEE